MTAVGFLFGWEIIALAVVVFILVAIVIDRAVGHFWRDAEGLHVGAIEDVSANQERER